MTIQSRLFAVSDDLTRQRALTSQDAILAAMQAAQSFNISANVRLHWYDPDAASAWLAYARSDRFSREAINTLPAADQNARVVEMWTAFGRYWQCLNVSPYGWARFRRLCEAQWGYPSYALGGHGWRGKLNTPKRNGQYGGLWRQRAHNAVYAPPAPQGNYSPAFGGNRRQFYTSAGNPEFGPTDVVFGTPDPYAIENAGNRPGQRGVLPNTNFAPTVEVHRVWMQRNGDLIGSYPRGLDRAYADAYTTETTNVARRPISQAWHDYNFSEPPTNNPGRWDDWTVGFALPSAAVIGGTDVQWTVPPLAWYWELLRREFPLVTGSGTNDSAGYAYFPDIVPVVSSSVLDYLAAQGPDAMIREVMFDVMKRNADMAATNGIIETTLGDAAGMAEIAHQRDAAAPSTAAAILSGVATAAGGVVSLVTASPLGLAMGGMVSQAVKLIDALDNSAAEQRMTDIFGRLMPTLDTVGIVDTRIDAQRVIGDAGQPPTAGGGTLSFGYVFTGASVGTLSIVDMPHGGEVEVGQQREAPACRWNDPSLTVWRCTVPTGPQWVRVTAPTGEARLARTDTSGASPATLTWGAMFPEHRYHVGGLPPGSDVFVDGAPAMGTWTDGTQTDWQVFLPTGAHAIRMVPPGSDPVLVEVLAQGAESGASWAQLVAAGAQQRQTAAQAPSGSNAGLWLAGGVAIAAAALLVATMGTDGKRANPRRRRR